MFLAAGDRLLTEVIVVAGGHRLVPALVDARLVPGPVGVIPCLAFGRVQALVLPATLIGFLAVTVPVFPSVRPVHLPSPFHCAGGMPARRAARTSLAMAVSTTPGFVALTSHRPGKYRFVPGRPRVTKGAMTYRVSVIGTGYLGTAHAACLASLGFDVLGLDTDARQVASLAAGHLPFHEPGLPALLAEGLRSGRLRFTTSYKQAAEFADVHFVCVGTPQRAGSRQADTSQFEAAIDALAPRLRQPCLVVGKSTGPVGMAARMTARIAQRAPAGDCAELAWNPEFLREGHAVRDTLAPDRIVAGVRSARAEAVLREIYARPLAAGTPFLVTDLATAELVKTAANAFLATKISFINAMAEVCDAAGADVLLLSEALGHDPRIGAGSLRPGAGFGGGCLPKDIRAFMARAAELGVGPALTFLGEIERINHRCVTRIVGLAATMSGGSLRGRRVGVLGAAFKARSDDIRESPALRIARSLHDLGARVTVYDPVAGPRARAVYPELGYAPSLLAAADGADVLLVLTDWPEFAEADPAAVGKVVARRDVIDGRCVLDPARWQAAGWRYQALGRGALDGETTASTAA
jgi:UDPglucose 6-dehydrogenase